MSRQRKQGRQPEGDLSPADVQCTGVSASTGKRCRRHRAPGSETCTMHDPERMEHGPLTVPRCTAPARTNEGKPCKYPAVPGATVCRFHGGASRHVKAKAAARLAALVDPAIGTLAREMVKAERSSDRQRAANSILDRAGIARQNASEVDTARMLLIERLRTVRLERAEADDAPVLEVLEAEVVDG